MVSQLKYNNETDRYELGDWELHCGNCFEVLICSNDTEEAEWIQTRIEIRVDEHNGHDEWYLVGIKGVGIDGLFARR